MKTYKTSKYISKVFETAGEHTEWGGYYNYDFLSADKTKLLCNRTNFDGRAISSDDIVEVGYYDTQNGSWHPLDKSDSFNWPQATMLQWIPGTDNKEIIFNLSKDGRIISRIINIDSLESRDLCFPIYGITPDGKRSITLNLERSYWTPAYHYQSVINEECNVDVLEGDGIFSLDLNKNELVRIIDIKDVIAANHEPEFDGGVHWLEHIMISPSGTRFVFLHRFRLGRSSRRTRMLIANIDGSDMQVIGDSAWKRQAWSHFAWSGDDAFVMYARIPKNQVVSLATPLNSSSVSATSSARNRGLKAGLKNCIRAVHHKLFRTNYRQRRANTMGYQFYSLKKDGRFTYDYITSEKLLQIDGHPTMLCNGKYMLTDTYSDDKSYRNLMVYNTETKKCLVLGRFYAAFWGTPASCDLHPKVSADETSVVIDTAYCGVHKMMVFDLNWEKIKEVIG